MRGTEEQSDLVLLATEPSLYTQYTEAVVKGPWAERARDRDWRVSGPGSRGTGERSWRVRMARAPNRSEAWPCNAPRVNVGWALQGLVGLGFSLSTLLMFPPEIRGIVFEGDVCLIHKISGLFFDVIVYSLLIYN